MKTISILVLNHAVPAAITDARYAFEKVNDFLKARNQPPRFVVQYIADTEVVPLQGGRISIHVDSTLDRSPKSDLVIIPSLAGDMLGATYVNREYANWIAQQYKGGAEIASMCTGAFLLAFSGLMKGRQCTTHWQYANEFAYLYPTVNLVDEKMITDQNGLYSSGGNNAWWNLLLHLIEKFTSREMAILAAKYFVVDIDKDMQSPFIVFNGLKDHDDEVIKSAQQYIEANYAEKLTVDQLADKFIVTRRTFERRFKKATRHTVSEYMQRVKIEAAKKQLEMGRKSISEIMLEVGYVDIQAFREVFKRVTGITPVEYRSKYNNASGNM
ncbi:GlxA family transcriptional regulator [Flavihumibacter petaseus]|uniref:Putative AraC family transcriptional regulator n=1 Tax=Flavihumibacter petaseus NBRC 106054 TaxID=1220578 RepID=A0A0E9N008_9BACT|nr:helix-turn-helix domain-containing protein [Flavihumibacter petaseus]GAO43123.1 putative AraC family transcriptional regulator [Flavihumibacter petaseus NBRC 106054]